MPTKAFDSTTGRVRVEFRLPPEAGAAQAWLCGDFNDWSLDATPLLPASDGALVATVELEPGRDYRFRYWLGDDRWENDWAADAYVDTDFGGHDSLISIPASVEPPTVEASADEPPPEKVAAKKAPAKKAAAAKKR